MKNYKSTVRGLAILVIAALPLTILAQPGNIEVGDKVKIHAPTYYQGSVKGWVEEMSEYGMMISDGDKQMTISYDAIRRIKVSDGQKSRWSLGMGLGLIPGVLVGLMTMESRCNTEVSSCYLDFTDLENGIRVMRGAAIGMFVGSLVGAGFKTDRWKPVSLDLKIDQRLGSKDALDLHPVMTLRIPINR